MFVGVTLAVVTGIIWAFLGLLLSQVVKRKLAVVAVLEAAFLLSTVVAWALLVNWSALRGGPGPRVLEAAGLQFIGGVLTAGGYLAMQRAMQTGHHGAVWTIGQCAMVFPFLAAVLVFGERPKVLQELGVGLIVLSLVLLGLSKPRAGQGQGGTGSAWLSWALLTFLLLGGVQVLASVPSHWKGWTDAAGLRTPAYLTGATLGYLATRLFRRSGGPTNVWRWAVPYGAGVVVGLITIFASLDQMARVQRVGLVYPISIGVCIAGFAVYTALVLRERSALSLSGIAAAVAGIALLSMG